MKTDIHPQYHKDAKIICACGAKYAVGATRSEIRIEICANCHPFYTGKEQLIDTAGRAQKFAARREKAAAIKPKAKKAVKARTRK